MKSCISKLFNQQEEWLRDEPLEEVLKHQKAVINIAIGLYTASTASHTRRKISVSQMSDFFHLLSTGPTRSSISGPILSARRMLRKQPWLPFCIVIGNQELKQYMGLLHYRKKFPLFSQKFVQLHICIEHIYPGSPTYPFPALIILQMDDPKRTLLCA